MIGIVLCGGQSTRMGTDKGMLQYNAGTWAQNALDKLTALKLPVMLSVNEAQYNKYAALFDTARLIKDNTQFHIGGPLCGVLSAHQYAPGEDLLVLACDMPLMEVTILEELLTIYKENSSAEAVIFTIDNEPEPLCAIYCSRGLTRISHLNDKDQLPKQSMKFVLGQLKTFSIPAGENQKKYFSNINSHAGLNGL